VLKWKTAACRTRLHFQPREFVDAQERGRWLDGVERLCGQCTRRLGIGMTGVGCLASFLSLCPGVHDG
jgi:hypothetical protein